MEKKENEKGYILGIIGALIGGLIATIPWILMYVYANMIYSILAILVAIAALKGYQLFKGKVDKKLPYIIVIVSLISITIATLVIIPNLLIVKEYGKFSIDLFKVLYESKEFTQAIIQDYVTSLLFTGLGISGVISSINREIKSGKTKINWNSPVYTPSKEKIEETKKIFLDRNATDALTTIPKEEVLSLLKDDKEVLNYLVAKRIVQSKKGGYYYSLKNEENPEGSNKKAVIIAITFLAVVLICSGIFAIINSDSKKTDRKDTNTDNKVSENQKEKEVSYNIYNGFVEQKDNEDENGFYLVPKEDSTGKKGFIRISYGAKEDDSNYEESKKALEDEFKKDKEYKKVVDVKDKSKYKVALYTFDYKEYNEKFYYIFDTTKYAFIDCIEYKKGGNENLDKACLETLESFKWEKYN